MRVGRLQQVAEFCRAHDLLALVDNTFATPINFRPLEHGFHLVWHSATKYLNGHSDLVAGCLMGSADLVEKVRGTLNLFGGTLDPHAGFLLARGAKTLALRVRQQNASALALARMLEKHGAVATVNYPGLASHPDHEHAAGLLSGFGGMVSFRLAGGESAADALMGRLTIPTAAPSLGGVETLLTRPSQDIPCRSQPRGASPDGHPRRSGPRVGRHRSHRGPARGLLRDSGGAVSIRVIGEGRFARFVDRDGWEYVERKNVTGIVAIVAVTDDERVVLVEQYRPAVEKRVLEIPAGLAGDSSELVGEPLVEAARRELLEEAGYEAETWEELGEATPSAGILTEVITMFRASGLRRVSEGGGDDAEEIQVHLPPLETVGEFLADRVRAGAVIDMKVWAALWLARSG